MRNHIKGSMVFAVLVLIAVAFSGCAASTLELTVQPSRGTFQVLVNGEPWLSGISPGVNSNGRWLTLGNGLTFSSSANSTGEDPLGSYSRQQFTYSGGDTEIVVAFRVYTDTMAIVFEQSFPSGVENTTTGNPNAVVSAFPAFQMTTLASYQLGYVEWWGAFDDDGTLGPHIGNWDENSQVPTGMDFGPIAIFTEDASTVLVMSAFSEFMATSTYLKDGQLYYGIMGNASEIPAGYGISTIVYVGAGINAAVQEWGAALLQYYGKSSDGPSFDYVVNYLGYNTDHGSYYYYQTEPGKNYLETLTDVYNYAQSVGLPYQWVLLDSWWYFKGEADGVKNWTAMPSVFPGGDAGMLQLYETTGWPVVGHNRYWSANTDYATQNGGEFEFLVEPPLAMPLEEAFWDFLLNQAKKWGLHTYEQDWLYSELLGLPGVLNNVSVGRNWLMQMGEAAARQGLTVQYCMPYPRHAMQSVELSAVTQIRASDDYVPNPIYSLNQNWKIGSSSVFIYALGLAPFKDNFWSTSIQPDNPYNTSEPAPALQACVATLSTGPVTPSDRIGYADVALIMRSCNSGGMLLQPSRPATSLDAYFTGQAFGQAGAPSGEIWFTDSVIDDVAWGHVFAAEQLLSYTLTPSAIGWSSESSWVAYTIPVETFNISQLSTASFSASSPLELEVVALPDFQLWHLAPTFENGWTLLGELAKWVPVSGDRIVSVTQDSYNGVSFNVRGISGEQVEFFALDNDGKVTSFMCNLDASGRATLNLPNGC